MAEASIASFAPHLRAGPIHSTETEKACLGALILDAEGLTRIEGSLSEQDFYEEIHRRIFRAIVRLFSCGKSVDLVTLHNEISGDTFYQDAGGEGYLAELVDRVGSQSHLADYAGIIREKAVYRNLLKAASEIVEDCYREGHRKDSFKPSGGVREALDRAESKIFRLAHESGDSGLLGVRDLVHPLME
ncbi:MAG: DnaB-like helicase N-terminal domain-containing protein, partial [Elusimicrobiota bacterium]